MKSPDLLFLDHIEIKRLNVSKACEHWVFILFAAVPLYYNYAWHSRLPINITGQINRVPLFGKSYVFYF